MANEHLAVLIVDSVVKTTPDQMNPMGPPAKVKFKDASQKTWNYVCNGGENLAPLFLTVGNKVAVAFAESPFQMPDGKTVNMKFVNAARLATAEEMPTFQSKQAWNGGGGASRNTGSFSSGGSSSGGGDGKFRTPDQLQMMECVHAASRLMSGSGATPEQVIEAADKFFAHTMAAKYDPMGALVASATNTLGASVVPPVPGADFDDDIPF